MNTLCSKLLTNAIIFISLNGLSVSTSAQTVYKCGNSYSQSPCEGGRVLAVDDARDAAQKKQSDEATQRDSRQASLLAKERIAQEKAAAKRAPVMVKTTTLNQTAQTDKTNGVIHKITPKRIKTKLKKPEAFVAEVPGSQKNPVHKKAKKEKPATPA